MGTRVSVPSTNDALLLHHLMPWPPSSRETSFFLGTVMAGPLMAQVGRKGRWGHAGPSAREPPRRRRCLLKARSGSRVNLPSVPTALSGSSPQEKAANTWKGTRSLCSSQLRTVCARPAFCPHPAGAWKGRYPHGGQGKQGGRPLEAELVWLGGGEAEITTLETVGGSSQVWDTSVRNWTRPFFPEN